MIEVTLVYGDGSTWFAGGFPTLAAAEVWIENEKKQPYWKADTRVDIVELAGAK